MAVHVADTREDVTKILQVLQGNGGTGLVTKVALNRQSINRVWWWVGGISFGLVGLASGAIAAWIRIKP